jgi:hypothetical protein
MGRFVALASEQPVRAGTAAVMFLAAPAIILVGVVASANAALNELAAVAPAGWTRYQGEEGGTPVRLPVVLLDSGTPPDMQEVSYPDAALLQFDGRPDSGEIVQLSRQLDDLEAGRTYRFYLQIYDPGVLGDTSETLSVWLNGQPVWQRRPLDGCLTWWLVRPAPAERCGPGWHYLSIPWVADATSLTIVVERTAGNDPDAAIEATPAVRTLHLYPKY